MKATSKTSASAAEPWQSSGLVATHLTQCKCNAALQPHPGTGHCSAGPWDGTKQYKAVGRYSCAQVLPAPPKRLDFPSALSL